MVIEKVSFSWWENIKRTIAFFLCPELYNLEEKYKWLQEYSSWVYFKWHRDVRGKEKGLNRLNRKIKVYEKQIKQLKQIKEGKEKFIIQEN